MECKYIKYDYLKSFERIDNIINESTSYEELSYIPSRDKLTFNNGFYVNCAAMFVDIRGSSDLPNIHRRPTLAKLYRSYVSEVVALMNGNPLDEFGNPTCIEVNIVGDCVSGIFNTRHQKNIDELFSTAAKIRSLLKVMNYKFKKNGIETINIGIGISWGRALMVKAGYIGTGINDVIWMGDVVNEAANLCSYGSKDSNQIIVVSPNIYNNLNEHNKSFLIYQKNFYHEYYHGDVVWSEMEEWYNNNCKSNSYF
jgi:class 3 adenylate cyclase